ncbi:MAG: hypothetical protein WBE26_17275, partial [Phycisphaerae bacterium]
MLLSSPGMSYQRLVVTAFGCSVVLSAAALAGDPREGSISRIPSGQATLVDHAVPSAAVIVNEGDRRWQRLLPADLESYLPMPLRAESQGSVAHDRDMENWAVSYNLITGEKVMGGFEGAENLETLLADWVPGSVGAWDREVGDDGHVGGVANFSTLERVFNQEDYPWRVNAKMFFSQGGSNWVGSATLIDPMHAITAGHCVHEGDGGEWSTDVVIIPAYESGAAPYGPVSGVELHAWSGWTENGYLNYDVGVVDLDRPVGALTDWHGYGYDTHCSFFTENTFHNAGYPAASPYNGCCMYYWYGTFDSCPYNPPFAQINRVAYGGMSGSGAYYVDGLDNATVYAVLSSGTPSYTLFARMTQGMFEDVRDRFIADDVPSTFDLIPLDVQCSPETILKGDPLSELNYLVHNYSSASWSSSVDVNVYLSTDDEITTSDTLIGSHDFVRGFGPKTSFRIDVVAPPTIPGDTPDGYYWIGVILDIADADPTNNHTGPYEVCPIRVIGPCTLDPPQAETPLAPKNRYLAFTPDYPDRQTALRVTLTASALFPGDVGMQWWVGSPGPVSEAAASTGPAPVPTFMAAELQSTWNCMDWSTVGLLDVSGCEIVPSATYDVQAID